MECYNLYKQMQSKGGKKPNQGMTIDDDSDNSDDFVIGDDDFNDGKKPKIEDNKPKRKENNIVHLHFQQRTTRKCMSIVQGLPDDLDFKKIVRCFKKAWCCNGTTLEHPEFGQIIQLQGDHRKEISKFLIEEGLASKDMIKVHGY